MRPQHIISLVSLSLAAPVGLLFPTPYSPLSTPIALAQTTQDRKAEAERLNEQGIQQCQTGQCEAALQSFQQALSICREIKDRKNEGYTLGNLGITYKDLGNYAKAIEYVQQWLVIVREVKDRQSEGRALGHLGLAYKDLGNYGKAIEYQQQALVIAREIHDRQSEGYVLGNLGNIYQLLGNYDKAIEHTQQGLAIAREIHDHQSAGKALGNLGLTYLYMGNYDKAIEYAQQWLAIAREIHDRQSEGKALNNLGIAYQRLGNYTEAIEYLQQWLAIAQEAKNRLGEGNAFGNLGNAYYSLGNYAKAIEYQQQALEIAREIGNRNGEGATLNNLGLTYINLNSYAKAIEYQQQALKIVREIGNRDGEGTALGNLGFSYINLGDHTKAIKYAQQALVIAQEIGDRESEGIALSNIGFTLAKQKQPALAIVFYKQSVNVRESIRQDIRKLPRESQEAYAQSVAGTYRNLADLLIQQGRLPEAQAVLELLKLRELKDFTRDAGIDSPGINLARVEDAALKQILQRYTTIGAFSQKIDACEQTHCPELKQLQDQRDQLNQAITTELTQQRAILTKYFATESATLTPDKLTPEARDLVNAQPGTILIYPLILKTKIQFLIALKAGDGAVILRPVETPNVSAETLFKTIQTFREQLQAPTNLAALKATSQQLYTWLIKPLEPELNNPAIKHLVFAPDSTTRYIPLAALFDGKRYLIERFSISTITAASETDTSETFAQLPVNDRFLLATGASTFANANPLENVPAELNAIVKPPNSRDQQGIYPGAELLNTQFDFEALKANLKGHRVLHIATHGSFQPGRVEDSYLLSGRSEKLTTTLINQLGQYGLGNVSDVLFEIK